MTSQIKVGKIGTFIYEASPLHCPSDRSEIGQTSLQTNRPTSRPRGLAYMTSAAQEEENMHRKGKVRRRAPKIIADIICELPTIPLRGCPPAVSCGGDDGHGQPSARLLLLLLSLRFPPSQIANTAERQNSSDWMISGGRNRIYLADGLPR